MYTLGYIQLTGLDFLRLFLLNKNKYDVLFRTSTNLLHVCIVYSKHRLYLPFIFVFDFSATSGFLLNMPVHSFIS